MEYKLPQEKESLDVIQKQNINNPNLICQLHKKNYNKFCFHCKNNLCELCQNHNDHYVESFKNIYPLEQDIEKFNQISLEIYNNKNEIKYDIIDSLIKSSIKLKLLFIQSFSKNFTNYNYINNVNNIIRCINISNGNYTINQEKIKYIDYTINKNELNNIENKLIYKSVLRNNIDKNISIIWCMKKLNNIIINNQDNLELIAIGGGRNLIILLNAINLKIYQKLENHYSDVYSLEQYKDSPHLLFSSSEDGTVNIYKLNKYYTYELIQKLKKSEEKGGGEINKVIILSNKLLATGDHKHVTIWKNINENKINYQVFYEININKDTCHLLEVNPSIFVVTQYTNLQVYKNDEKEFPLLGEMSISSHGESSNGLSKISDNIICCGGKNVLNILSIFPLQIIQKIPLDCTTVLFTYITKNNYLYCNFENIFIQYKIVTDEDNNFIEIVERGKYHFNQGFFYRNIKAILPFDDGRIFLRQKIKDIDFFTLII